MQAKDDPSVLIPAEDVWAANGSGLTVLRRRLADPQERLLGGLGHALRLWPELEPALRDPAPTGVELTVEAAYRFLREAAPALEQAGFAVQAPPWWSKRLSVKLHVRPLDGEWEEGIGLLGLDGLCAFEWRLALGDSTLSLSELRELAALKLPLVQARGQWVALRPEDVEAALAFFERRQQEGAAPVDELLRAGLGLDGAESGLSVAGIEAEGWLKELLSTDGDRRLEEMGTPAALQGELRPYQQRGLAWLSFLSSLGLGACLADDMGLGKTVQLLALLLAERERRNGSRRRVGPTLLVCPMSVVGNWERETERFAPTLRVHVHHGRDRLGGREFARAARRSDLVITTYAVAARDRETLDTVQWERVALDEAQNIQSRDAKQTRAIRGLKARHRVALTGTPVENRLSELHSIMDFLNPGLLGPAARFRSRFATPIERYRDEAAAAQLKRATGPFILRRLKTDKTIVSDLPDKIEMKVLCHLTREQATLYQAVVDEMLEAAAVAEGIERRGVVLAAMMKLKQVCNHPAQLLKDRSQLAGRSGKLARLEEILEEALAEGDSALLFTQFAELGHMLKGHLQERFGREVLFLHGGTPKSARDEMVARFQGGGGPAVFVLSLKAGGTGLNLTAANHVIHFDRWWNPAVEDQATDRAFRIGQRRNVQVRKLTCVGTLEERIDRMIEEKKDLTERIVGTGEAWLTELDTAQLSELVALSRNAVGKG
jgi:SNF2 family DNA or RNA helicase